MPKLSICIPTFNRASFLEQLLNSIPRNYDSSIEIIVSDNASTDETKSVVNPHEKNLNIKYSKNTVNIGAAKNLNKSANLANGEYIWFFSDDDVMIEGAIDYFLNFVERNPCVDYVFYPRRLTDKALDVILCDRQPISIVTDNLFLNGKQMLISVDEMSALIGFFSSTIVRREVWLKASEEIEIQSEWQHLAILFKLIIDKKCAILGNVGVLCRLDNSGRFNINSQVWFDEYVLVWQYAKILGYPIHLCDLNIKKIIHSFSKNFVLDKARNLRVENIFSCLIRLKCFDASMIVFPWFFLSFLPPSILGVMLKLYALLNLYR